jgi:hypothetical protein
VKASGEDFLCESPRWSARRAQHSLALRIPLNTVPTVCHQ